MTVTPYGWPAVTATAGGSGLHEEREEEREACVHIEVVGRLLLVLKAGSIQVWTRGKARMKLGHFVAQEDDYRKEGSFRRAAWNLKQQSLVVLTEAGFIYVFGFAVNARSDALPDCIPFDASLLGSGGRPPSVDVFVRSQFAPASLYPVSLVVDEKTILLGCSNGELVSYNWDGYQKGKLSLLPPVSDPKEGDPLSNPQCVVSLQYCSLRCIILLTLQNGMCALYSLSGEGLRVKAGSSTFCWVTAPRSEMITCAALSPMSHTLAVGTQCGNAHLYSIHGDLSYVKLRTLSLSEWGYTGRTSGAVHRIRWTPDSKALAIVWEKAGLSVWSSFGCRLMYYLEKGSKQQARRASLLEENESVMNEGGTARSSTEIPEREKQVVCWSPEGLQLFTNSKENASNLLTHSFARGIIHSAPAKTSMEQTALLSAPAECLLGEDRVLCIYCSDVTGNTEKPILQHLMLPQSYIASNWPAKDLAMSKDGLDIAVSGERGVVLYNMRQKRWRMFGNVNQESQIRCHSLMWVMDMIMLCVSVCKGRPSYFEDPSQYLQNSVQLQFYPKYHLDSSSLLVSKRLNAVPQAINSQNDCLIILSGDVGKLEAAVLRVNLVGKLDPTSSSKSKASITVVKEVCIVTMRPVPIVVSFISTKLEVTNNNGPTACIVLHMDGQLCHLDLETGSEKGILDRVEHFWADNQELAKEESTSSAEGPGLLSSGLLWTYGARGINILHMERVLKLVGENKLARLEVQETDPELEFDKEVYPLGLFPNINSIIGISQHSSNIPHDSSHGFHPLPKSHPVLSPMVRYLLSHGAKVEARELAKRSTSHPHFSHSLEWLVFTVLEKEYSMSTREREIRELNSKSCYTLTGVVDLIKDFSNFVDVIVRVARKIDPIHWKLLFSQTGEPSFLFEKALRCRSYGTAAGFLVIVETLEGPDLGQECALNLLQETLQEGEYDLTGELVRFLVRSARDMLSNAQESTQQTSSWYGQWFGSFSPITAPSERERLLKLAVHKFLSTHAAALIASRRMQDLAAFIHKSGFDIVPLLREERQGVAKLTSFKNAVKEIKSAFTIENTNRLISLADSELLLEAFREAGLTEWVIVLATILNRSPLLLNMFRDDRALWSVYIKNLQEDSNYTALLEELEAGMNAHTVSGRFSSN
jgi:WD40 repeat protein